MLETIYTSSQRNRAVEILANFKNRLYRKRKQRKFGAFLADLPLFLAQPLKKIFKPDQKVLPEKLAKRVEKTKEDLLNLPTAKITLAYYPTEDQIQELALALRKKFDQNLVLEEKFSIDVCPGCILEFKGKRYNLKP